MKKRGQLNTPRSERQRLDALWREAYLEEMRALAKPAPWADRFRLTTTKDRRRKVRTCPPRGST